MIAIGYRNLLRDVSDSTGGVPAGERLTFAQMNRRHRRETHRRARPSMLAKLLESRQSSRTVPSVQLTVDRRGKPELTVDGESVGVSFSHSGPLTLAGITDLGRIGVDVEYQAPGRAFRDLAGYAFGAREQAAVRSAGASCFYRIWTLREAMSKVTGAGFSLVTDGQDYFPDALDSNCWQSTIDGRRWLFSTGELARSYTISVALSLDPDCRIDRFDDLLPVEIL